jgi:hypothetical protein
LQSVADGNGSKCEVFSNVLTDGNVSICEGVIREAADGSISKREVSEVADLSSTNERKNKKY